MVGFQAVNGNSLVKFTDNSKLVSMIQFASDLRIVNMENDELKETLHKLVYNSNLDETSIIQQIKSESKISDKEFKDKIAKRLEDDKLTEKQLLHGIELDINKISPTTDEIKKETELQILKNLEESNIKRQFKKEKPIAIVLDNYKVHTSTKFIKACKILNIKLIFLPSYSPHLNPIEQIWKSIKRIISSTYIEDKEHLKLIIHQEFYKLVKKETFYKEWINKYIINN